ncbi:hypothetical protein HPB52_014101 [Rhipicephalus sanguineus]|uniref:Uncharacterized protein n=1 Tax=Rhipicephalus sanguineus TaxID=34632 RepID=A0A9D4QBG0_RHISA|nr:hypothetical protein HPB52_014101 [Rhipicephalus sanguineus]
MCREFVSASAPKSSAPAADMCVLKFPLENDARTNLLMRKEEGGGPPPPPLDKENNEELAMPKKIVSAAPVSFAAIGDSCGSSLLLNIGRKMSPCPPLGPVLANPLRTLASTHDPGSPPHSHSTSCYGSSVQPAAVIPN